MLLQVFLFLSWCRLKYQFLHISMLINFLEFLKVSFQIYWLTSFSDFFDSTKNWADLHRNVTKIEIFFVIIWWTRRIPIGLPPFTSTHYWSDVFESVSVSQFHVLLLRRNGGQGPPTRSNYPQINFESTDTKFILQMCEKSIQPTSRSFYRRLLIGKLYGAYQNDSLGSFLRFIGLRQNGDCSREMTELFYVNGSKDPGYSKTTPDNREKRTPDGLFIR